MVHDTSIETVFFVQSCFLHSITSSVLGFLSLVLSTCKTIAFLFAKSSSTIQWRKGTPLVALTPPDTSDCFLSPQNHQLFPLLANASSNSLSTFSIANRESPSFFFIGRNCKDFSEKNFLYRRVTSPPL